MATFKAYPKNAPQPKPSKNKWFRSPENPMPINSVSGGNCVWYAYGRFQEAAALGGKKVKVAKSGNAWTYYDADKFSPKCKRGKIPQIGAIICWKGGYGGCGHVAFVEEINPKTGDIRVSESGWTAGWIGANTWLKKSKNYTNWSALTLRGFIYNPVEFDNAVTLPASAFDNAMDAALEAASPEITSSYMRMAASQLYSSDNYSYVEATRVENAATKFHDELMTKIKTNLSLLFSEKKDEDFADIFKNATKKAIEIKLKQLTGNATISEANRKTNSFFNISRYLVEAPFVRVNIGGISIGSYGGDADKYPNYIQSIDINKANGELNHYRISLIHQIRAGEDPNLLDKIFARNQFKKITISYGDTTAQQTFNDVDAVITDVKMNRDYTSAKITYVLEAVSAGGYVTAHTMNFPAVTDKPSNVIKKLLYNSQISNELKLAFPAMASESEVFSKGLIPTNDKVVRLDAKQNIDPISYINFLVGNMSNITDNKDIRDSVYFISYNDSSKGAGFSIREVKAQNESVETKYNSVYEVTVGYPDNNDIFSFNVTNDKAWAILYSQATGETATDSLSNLTQDTTIKKAEDVAYSIANTGNLLATKTPLENLQSNPLNETQKNWWTVMTKFPVSANLTIRGLLRPAFLTNYIRINVVFYGQKHITSGLYTIIEQRDTLSGSGFRTNFSLIRVGN